MGYVRKTSVSVSLPRRRNAHGGHTTARQIPNKYLSFADQKAWLEGRPRLVSHRALLRKAQLVAMKHDFVTKHLVPVIFKFGRKEFSFPDPGQEEVIAFP